MKSAVSEKHEQHMQETTYVTISVPMVAHSRGLNKHDSHPEFLYTC